MKNRNSNTNIAPRRYNALPGVFHFTFPKKLGHERGPKEEEKGRNTGQSAKPWVESIPDDANDGEQDRKARQPILSVSSKEMVPLGYVDE